ncbi:hypothetical protein [Algoriphagus sp.]|uniref:hypothetical protein n=1 Tax=Algoriphagus sp. TaxID=1872435 RepID=UPI003F714656
MTINLDNLNGLPDEFIAELESIKTLFQKTESFEELLENYLIENLVFRINEYCLEQSIFGFHYTRAIYGEISKAGLTCRSGREIRDSFITRYEDKFTLKEIDEIKKAWKEHFNSQQNASRDKRLFFNFTTSALDNHGAEPLLSNFGGEQVYFPLQYFDKISDKIKGIGEPFILKCKLDPNDIQTFHDNPWGRIAVSTFHCRVNPRACQEDQDGYQVIDVSPENIEIIRYYNNNRLG